MIRKIWLCLVLLLVLPFVESAHFIVGIVNDAADGQSANGKSVVLWNPANGLADNLTDVVGPSGNSGVSNVYFIDCEILDIPCEVGDQIRARVIDSGDSYFSAESSLIVTGAGFDIMPNMTLNSPPAVFNLSVDDGLSVPAGEIDLVPLASREVYCSGIIYEYEGESGFSNISVAFYDNSVSSFYDLDDNNYHYTNNSCYLDSGYGGVEELFFNCTFQVKYYANSGNWNCTVWAQDNVSAMRLVSNSTTVNFLLALSLDSPLDFGELDTGAVSAERIVNVTNAGNSRVNLSLFGYGAYEGDGFAYNCSGGRNISVENMKYNLTSSNPGSLTTNQFAQLYRNLTSNVVINKFDLAYRTDDLQAGLDEVNATYWRVYVPSTITGNCSGNLVFGAVRAAGN